MITCRELTERLADWLSDELPAAHRDLIEAHLKTCSCCSAYAESYYLTIRLSRQLPARPIPNGLRQRLETIWRQHSAGAEPDASESSKGKTASG